jgi:hypothetical protein
VNKPVDQQEWLVAMADKIESDGPQTVAVEGRGRLTVLTEAEFQRLSARQLSFKDWLTSGPKFDDLEFERDARPSRDFSF